MIVNIQLSSRTLVGKIFEARRKLDMFLLSLRRPQRGEVYDCQLVKVDGCYLTYKIFSRPKLKYEII